MTLPPYSEFGDIRYHVGVRALSVPTAARRPLTLNASAMGTEADRAGTGRLGGCPGRDIQPADG